MTERFDLQRDKPIDQFARCLWPAEWLFGEHLTDEPDHAGGEMGCQFSKLRHGGFFMLRGKFSQVLAFKREPA